MSAAIYGTEVSRCVAAVGGSDDTLFVVGTQKLRGANEVHLVAHDRDRNALVNKAVWAHHPEIWDLQPCPGRGGCITPRVCTHSRGCHRLDVFWRPYALLGLSLPVSLDSLRGPYWVSVFDLQQNNVVKSGILHPYAPATAGSWPPSTTPPRGVPTTAARCGASRWGCTI
jgi:hypothetical protein